MHDLERIEREFSWGKGRERAEASALREEAVGSARLAGAAADPTEANEMLREGREAVDEDSVMIRACHRTLQQLPSLAGTPLTQAGLFELHRELLEGLPDGGGGAGRFRRESDPIHVPEGSEGVYRPPAAAELPARLGRMLDFANGNTPGFFVPPFIRAVVLHFWVAHDRPFPDGNGRAGRALFHWAMLRQGYPRILLLPLSPLLLEDEQRYRDTFLQTETDGNDLTYFVLHQAMVLQAACRRRRERDRLKEERLGETGRRWRGFATLNSRQQALIDHALRCPEARYIIAGHQRSHGVTHQTARDDLFDLVSRSLLTVTREHRVYQFRTAPDLPDRLRSGARPRPAPPRFEPEETLPTSLL